MKKYLFFVLLLSIFLCDNAESYVYDHSVSIDSFEAFDDIEINNDVVITATDISGIVMNGPVYLYNQGTINGSINTNGYNLFIYNSGSLNGEIINTSGGNVTQIVRSESELTDVNVASNNKILRIDGYQNINLNDITSMDASSFVIKESSVIIDDFSDWQQWDAVVHLEGPVSLIINNASTVNSGEVINHTVYGDVITVKITDLDVMYTTQQVLQNGGIVLNIVRETNYDVIFGDGSDEIGTSSALELIRKRHPNDKLLKALDNASDMDEFNSLKKLSYRFSHDILLRPIKVINNFSFLGVMNTDNDSGIGVTPHYILSDNINGFGGRIYMGYGYNNLYFNIGLNVNSIRYTDELNDFSGMSYGLDIKSKQMFNKFWLNEILGFSLTDYKAEYVSSNDSLRDNPLGVSWYADASFGYDFKLLSDIIVSPVVGMMYQHYNIADVSDIDSYLHGGMNSRYSFTVDGIKYDYALSGGVATNGSLFATMTAGFLSVTDRAGVSIDASVFKDDFDYYCKFALNAKVLF